MLAVRTSRGSERSHMRYSKEHKVKAKQAILSSAARALKRDGFNGIGVDGLAASAQVTSGGFYSSFATKEALLAEVIGAELGAMFSGLADADADADPAGRGRRLAELIAVYLSDEHCQDAADGCVMPSLSADVARAGAGVRETYRLRMTELVATLALAMDGTAEEREQRAWAAVATIVGAVTVARALPPGPEAGAVLDAAFATVMQTAGIRDGRRRAES